jgi:glycosyltransferase involved in cell wall biosynthesis
MPPDTIAVDASRAGTEPRTGTEWYSFEVIRALINLHDRPPLTLYHRDDPDPELDGSKVHHVRVRQRRLWTHVGLSRAMRCDRPAALYVPSHVIPLAHPRASVVTIHDLGYIAEPEAHAARTRRMLDLTTRWNARVAKRIIAISGQTRDDLITHYRTAANRITVVHSGVDRERFRELPPSAVTPVLARLDIDRDYIFFLSTIQPRKNLVRLVEAFEQRDDEDLLLVIGGTPGWLSEPIIRRIRESPAAERIRMLGRVADEDVAALYNGARVFALPSLYEGFGMGVLEAMACGCPVVTSNRSSMPEVAGDSAILVDPFDVGAIRDGLSTAMSEPTRTKLVVAGRERVQPFSWTSTAAQTLTVIRQAIDDR